MTSMHTPERTCCACGAKKPQLLLLRVSSTKGAAPFVDEAKRTPGRGAYLCREIGCLEKAFKRRALERALKLQAPLDSTWKTDLRRTIAGADDQTPA